MAYPYSLTVIHTLIHAFYSSILTLTISYKHTHSDVRSLLYTHIYTHSLTLYSHAFSYVSSKIRDITQDLDRLLQLPEGATSASLPETSLTHAMAAAACLVSVLQLMANEDNFHRFTLARFDLGQVCVCVCLICQRQNVYMGV